MYSTPSSSVSLSAFKKKLPNNNMNTPPPSPCSTINKTPKQFTPQTQPTKTPKPSSSLVRKQSVKKPNTQTTTDSPYPDIAKYHVTRPLTPSTISSVTERSDQKFSFQIDKNQVEENCKKPSHARLGLNISQLNSSFYDLSKVVNQNSTTSSMENKSCPPESFIVTKRYRVPPRLSSNEYMVTFDTAHKKGVVCSSDLDPLSKPIKKAEALKEKRKILAEKISLATKGAAFSPVSRLVKNSGSVGSFPSTPTSATSLPEETFRNVIQSGCVNDVMSKDIERMAQEGNHSVKDMLMNGYFLHSGRCVDLEALQQDICTQILIEDANANVEELAPHFKLNVVLQLSYLPSASYFNVQLERTCSMVGNVVKGLSIENDMKNVKSIADSLNEEFSSLETKIREDDPKLVYFMNTANFPTSIYIEKEEDLQTSIEKLGAVHGCIITCILRMKLSGISKKDLSKLPKCFRSSNQYFLAKLICNDNLNKQFLSQGIWQLLSLELFDADLTPETTEIDISEITSDLELEGTDTFEEQNQTPLVQFDQESKTEENEVEIQNEEQSAEYSQEKQSFTPEENTVDEFVVENIEQVPIHEEEQPQTTGEIQTTPSHAEEVIKEMSVDLLSVEQPQAEGEITNESGAIESPEIKENSMEQTEPLVSEEELQEVESIEGGGKSGSSVASEDQNIEEIVSEPEEPVEEGSSEPQVYIQQTGQEIFNLQGQMIEVNGAKEEQIEKISESVEEKKTEEQILEEQLPSIQLLETISSEVKQAEHIPNEETANEQVEEANHNEESVNDQQNVSISKADEHGSLQEAVSSTSTSQVEMVQSIEVPNNIEEEVKKEKEEQTEQSPAEEEKKEEQMEISNKESQPQVEETPQEENPTTQAIEATNKEEVTPKDTPEEKQKVETNQAELNEEPIKIDSSSLETTLCVVLEEAIPDTNNEERSLNDPITEEQPIIETTSVEAKPKATEEKKSNNSSPQQSKKNNRNNKNKKKK